MAADSITCHSVCIYHIYRWSVIDKIQSTSSLLQDHMTGHHVVSQFFVTHNSVNQTLSLSF